MDFAGLQLDQHEGVRKKERIDTEPTFPVSPNNLIGNQVALKNLSDQKTAQVSRKPSVLESSGFGSSEGTRKKGIPSGIHELKSPLESITTP